MVAPLDFMNRRNAIHVSGAKRRSQRTSMHMAYANFLNSMTHPTGITFMICRLPLLLTLLLILLLTPCREADAQSPAGNRNATPKEPRDPMDASAAGKSDLSSDQRENRKGGQGQNKGGGGKGGGGKGGGSGLGNYTVPPPANNVPDHLYDVILGRPTDTSVTIRIAFHKEAEAHIEYGLESGKLSEKSPIAMFREKETHDFELKSLSRNCRYYYRIVYTPKRGKRQASEEHTFHTQRTPGSPFTFTVTSDSHLDENTSGEVYLRTLANALNDAPDFHLELGDTFMTGKYVQPELSEPQYWAQRYYLGSLCHSSSLFFALGNHDGESGSRGSMRWATQTRKRLFPNPEPNDFYSGNDQEEPEIGLPQNYYQWTWGDAQFIVLDPFRYTTQRSRDGNNWSWTLGDKQYRWLKNSLETIDAKYRFVFLHHLVGGSSTNNRGGIEVAQMWEWGGKGASGNNEFARQRPDWEMPIHELLVKHGVSIVFHGHDHLFVKQELDGIIYQEVPQPGHPRSGNTNTAKEYGYLSGEIQSSSGLVRVRVGTKEARADYVRTYLPSAESANKKNGDVSFSYVVASRSAENPK